MKKYLPTIVLLVQLLLGLLLLIIYITGAHAQTVDEDKTWLLCTKVSDKTTYIVPPERIMAVVRYPEPIGKGHKIQGDFVGMLLIDTEGKGHFLSPAFKDNDTCIYIAKPKDA